MKIHGQFILNPGTPQELILPNTMTSVGSQMMYQSTFQATALAATFYLGLVNNPLFDWANSTIANLTGGGLEPVGNGYARQAVTRNGTDWTVSFVNNLAKVRSKNLVFTASANWNVPWQRMFLCDVSSGTSGNLFAVSRKVLNAPLTVLSGAGPTMAWEQYMRP